MHTQRYYDAVTFPIVPNGEEDRVNHIYYIYNIVYLYCI